MRHIIGALLLMAAPLTAQVTRDTTIYTATRIRTAANGNILSVSVTKIPPPTSGRVDTVTVARVDTVKLPSTGRDTLAWVPTIRGDTIYFALLNWSLRNPPLLTVIHPFVGKVVHDTVTVIRHDTVTVGSPVRSDTLSVLHVDSHVFLYAAGGVPAGQRVYLEASSHYLGTVNASTTGWQAWKYDRPTVDASGYPHTTPPRLLGSMYPTQDAAARALYGTP